MASTPTASPTVTPTATSAPITFKISAYIDCDLTYTGAAAPTIKSGFKVEVKGTALSVATDNSGYFEIPNVPGSTSGYIIKISKPNYLYREVKSSMITSNVQLSTQSHPLLMWAGDMQINGIQDNAVNMVDVMEVARYFNTVKGDGRYSDSADLDMDNAINMSDIMIVAKHFNAVPSSYPDV